MLQPSDRLSTGRSWRRKLLGSGWVPALLVVLLAAVLVHRAAHVSLRDIVAFSLYLVAWIVLPGTAVWRLTDPRQRQGRRPLAEDLAIGALVGYVLEFPAYLVCLAAGLPRLYLVWPVVVLVATWAIRRRRSVFHLGEPPSGRSWWWTTAILMAYLVFWFANRWWSVNPSTGSSLRHPQVDEPYHLGMAVGLKHIFPPQYPFVVDTPLEYHWLSHLHVAAASWVTGIESLTLLRTLSLPVLFLIVAFATSRVAVRLTGVAWVQPVTLAALLVMPASFTGWTDPTLEGLLSTRLVASPSAGFVNAALLLGVLLVVEMLISRRTGWWLMGLTALTFVAMAAAKSTSLPTFMAGLLGATVLCSLLERRLHWVGALLTATSVVSFVAVQTFFFGGNARGLNVGPLGLMTAQGRIYPSLLDDDGTMSMTVKLLVVVSYLAYLSLGASLLGLLARGGWRRPERMFLVIAGAAGFGAALVFHRFSYSEFYFQYVVMLILVLGAVLGLHHVVKPLPTRFAQTVCAAGLALGVVGALVLMWVTTEVARDQSGSSPASQAVKIYVIPTVVSIVLVVLLVPLSTAVGALLTKRPDLARAGLVPSVMMVFAGMGAAITLHALPGMVSDPLPGPRAMPPAPTIAAGGIEAARWVRQHTPDDEVIATNAHCRLPGTEPPCDARNFWIAAYSERSVLVEGWSYVYGSTVEKVRPPGQDSIDGDFWDPRRLADNDAAMQHPTKETVQRLRKRYGVRWLIIDTRYPYDRLGLRPFAEVAFADGRYRVLKLK